MDCEAVLEAVGRMDWVSVLALAVSVLATALAILAAVRLEQALRLGVDFHVKPRNSVRVNRGPYLKPGKVIVTPRGPGALYDVDVSAWPAERISLIDENGEQMTRDAIDELRRPRITAEDEPIVIRYRHEAKGPGVTSPGPVWVGLVWSRPGWWGGFVPGGFRVRVDVGEDEPNERWSRFRKKWVRIKNGRAPKSHPVRGSVLDPSGTRD